MEALSELAVFSFILAMIFLSLFFIFIIFVTTDKDDDYDSYFYSKVAGTLFHLFLVFLFFGLAFTAIQIVNTEIEIIKIIRYVGGA